MTPPEYLTTVIPTPYTVLGMKLRPLSIGHLLLMQWQELFWTHEPDEDGGRAERCDAMENGTRGARPSRAPTVDDLVSGCLICSMRFREYQEFLQRPDLAKELRKRGRGLRVADLPEKFNLFIQYFEEGKESPEVEIPDQLSSSVILGTPWLQAIRVCLMSKLHVTSEETFDYPYRQALWDCFSVREAEGKLQIVPVELPPEMRDALAVCQELNKVLFAGPEAAAKS